MARLVDNPGPRLVSGRPPIDAPRPFLLDCRVPSRRPEELPQRYRDPSVDLATHDNSPMGDAMEPDPYIHAPYSINAAKMSVFGVDSIGPQFWCYDLESAIAGLRWCYVEGCYERLRIIGWSPKGEYLGIVLCIPTEAF